MIIKSTLIALVWLMQNSGKPPIFPQFRYKSSTAVEISNSIFNDTLSLVITGHLGCPPLMELAADIQNSSVDDSLQVLFILENTNAQIRQFNADSSNMWSDTRKYFKIKPIQQVCIGECDKEQFRKRKGEIVIGNQCRKLSKKLRTKDSPSIYLVNSRGEIISSQKSYFRGKTADECLRLLLKTKLQNRP